MKKELSCSVIRDLLPIYIDGLESEETNICIKEHLKECESCRSEYNKIFKNNVSNVNSNEVNALVSFKKKIILMTILAIVVSGICITVSIRLDNAEGIFNSTSEVIEVLLFYKIGVYFIPMFALLVSWIWKKTSYGSESYSISTVFFISLLIIVFALIMNLFIRYEHFKYICLI